MKKSVIVGFHIGFWFCYSTLVMVLLGLNFKGQEPLGSDVEDAFLKILFFTIIPSIISFYSYYFLVFKYIQKKKFFFSLLSATVISVSAALLGTALMSLILGAKTLTESEEPVSYGIIFMSFVSLIIGILALVIKGFITWFEEIKLKDELKQKNHEIEMALIKSQLDPHFLFNTLNNIDVLIQKDTYKASDYLNKLSDIMRFMLFEAKTDEILLAKEIEYIEKYLALQKIRTTNSSFVDFKVSGSAADQTIAPMIFIPFIENAFKHSTNKKMDNAITISIIILKETIKFECSNKFDPSQKLKQENNGLGNELIEKRLQLIYPEKHMLQILNKKDVYRVKLTINR